MKLGNAKKYNYSEDFKGNDCDHGRKKPLSIENDWEIGTVDIVMSCPDCLKVGEVKGRLLIDDDEIEWQQTSDIGRDVEEDVPEV